MTLSTRKEYCQYGKFRKEIEGGMSTFEATMTTYSIVTNDENIIRDRDSIMKGFIDKRMNY